MHELSVARHLLELVENAVRDEGEVRVVAVDLCLGERSHIDPEALRNCFEMMAAAGSAAGAGAAGTPQPDAVSLRSLPKRLFRL